MNPCIQFFKEKWLLLLNLLFIILTIFFIARFLVHYTNNTESLISAQRDTITQYQTLSGKTAYATLESPFQKHRADSLAKELLISRNEIEHYISLSTSSDFSSIKGTSRDTTYLRDTTAYTGKYGEYKDPYIDLAFLLTDSLMPIRISIKDTLSAVIRQQALKGGYLNSLIITNKSPYTHITGLQDFSYKVPKQYSRTSIALSAGVTVPNIQPYIGAGLSYSLFRFKKK